MAQNSLSLFKRVLALLLLVAVLVMGINIPNSSAQEDAATSVPVAEHDPQFAIEWMELTYDLIMSESINPPAGSRIYAYMGVTLYESMLPGMPDFNSLSYQIWSLPQLPYPDQTLVYDWPAVANTSLAIVLTGLFAGRSEETLQAIETMRQEQIDARAAEVEADVMDNSVAFGEEMAAALLAWIAEDGYMATREMTFEIPTGDPSLWVLTREGNPVEPFWGQIRPFVLTYADECAVPLNMRFDTDPDSTFFKQSLEVMETGVRLTPEQRDIALFWVDTPGISGTPAGHWVLIENQMVERLNLTLDRAAGMYAIVGVALGDAFISCWSLKYQVNLLRPETYIQQYIRRSWAPFIQTPLFPEYPSGHSVVSGAAAEVLSYLFGTVAFTDSSGLPRDLPPRSFTSFEAAASEAAISRIYGGIHYRVAIENGLRQGRCVGQRVVNTIYLTSIPQGE